MTRCSASCSWLGLLAPLALAACGGRASSPEQQVTPDEGEALPAEFESFEIRALGDAEQAEQSANSERRACKYALRLRVNASASLFAIETCQDQVAPWGLDGLHSQAGADLDPQRLAEVTEVYARLRTSRADRCSPGASVLTLAVDLPDADEPLRYADDDHSACPVPSVDSGGFVAGLDELLSTLTGLLADQ